MIGKLQSIRDAFKKLPLVGPSKPKPDIIQGAALEEILLETRAKYPRVPVWEKVEHPRDNFFAIHILPLHLPLHAQLEEPVRDLQKQMIADGTPQDLCRLNDPYEEFFSHIWVVEFQRWMYRPIGLSVFTYRPAPPAAQYDENLPMTTDHWWLHMVWLNPAQRNHRVLRNSVPYFEKWHPGFLPAREHPMVNRSLKPTRHTHQHSGKSIIWGDAQPQG